MSLRYFHRPVFHSGPTLDFNPHWFGTLSNINNGERKLLVHMRHPTTAIRWLMTGRRRAALPACLAAIVAACISGLSSAKPPTLSTRVTIAAYGDIRVGMTQRDAQRALDGKLSNLYEDVYGEDCRYLGSQRRTPDVSYMFMNGRLARIDVDSPNVVTLSGIHIGSSKQDVLRAYATKIVSSPHAYSDGEYLTMLSSDKKYGIRFEMDEHGIVISYHTGTADAIQLVEGCS